MGLSTAACGAPRLPLFRLLSVALLCTALAPAAAQGVVPSDLAARVQEQLRLGQAEAALQALDAAQAGRLADASLHFLRGVALMDLKRNEQASEVFTALAEAYPELPDPWNNLALLHVRAGQPELARQALEVALRNDPSHRTARLNLGEVHLMLAAQSWQRAGQSAPLEPAQRRRLEVVRELLSTGLPGR